MGCIGYTGIHRILKGWILAADRLLYKDGTRKAELREVSPATRERKNPFLFLNSTL
jgi:hypothetical protein